MRSKTHAFSVLRLPDWSWVALAVFSAALILRLTGIDSRDFWLDEVYSQFAISRDWPGLIDDRVSRGHSPFYFALMKVLSVDPANLAALRRATAILDAAAAGLLAGGITRYFGLRAGLFVAILYTFSPTHVHWAQNARPYGLLMFFTAMGLVGAMGLADTIGRGLADRTLPVRVPQFLFVIGWSGTAFTLTGGVVAFVSVALLPWLPVFRRGPMLDPTFRSRWRRAAILPWIVAVLTYMLANRLHVVNNIGDFWPERRVPFGPESLLLLSEQLTFGIARADTLVYLELERTGEATVALLLLAAIIGLAIFGALRFRDRPAVLPLIALGAGYSLLLLLMSMHTSLLVSRYFTPGWMGVLALAGLGLASLGRLSGMTVAVPLVALTVDAGISAATQAKPPNARAMLPFAERIEGSTLRHGRLLVDAAISRDLHMEILLMRLDEPELSRPALRSLDDMWDLERTQADGRPFLVLLREAEWDATYGAHIAADGCVRSQDGYVFAFEGGPCPKWIATGED